MLELREVFEMVTKQTEPDLDSWKQQEDKQRRAARKKKIGAIAVAVAAVIVVGVFVIATRPGSRSTPVTQPSESLVPIVTTAPMGVQLVTPDGTVVRQFPGNHSGDAGIQLSPDGTTLSYMNNGYLHTVNVDGTNDRILSPNGNTNSGDAEGHTAWSPDGSQIAYTFSGDVHVVNADGSADHAITHGSGGMDYYYPVWSVDGTIAMWGAGPGDRPDGGPADAEIYTVPATGGDVTRLTRNDVSNIEPAWSPDGKQIAYWNGGDLFVMRADGSHQHQVVSEGGSWAPSWSPDGKQIAYIVYVGDKPDGAGCCYMQLRTVDLSSGTVTDLPVHSDTDYSGPQWVSNGEILINRYD